MGSKKTKTTNEPWAPVQPYILKGVQATDRVFDQNQPRLDQLSGDLYGAGRSMASGAFGTNPYVRNAQAAAQTISNGFFLGNNPGQGTYNRLQQAAGGLTPRRGGADPSTDLLRGIATGGRNPATDYASRVAGGTYLGAQPSSTLYAGMMAPSYSTANPWLDEMIRQNDEDVRTNANRTFAARGMGAGISSAFAHVLSKNMANSDNALRYQNYSEAENRRLQAAGQSDAAWGGERARMDAATGQLSSDYGAAQDRALQAAQALGTQYGQAQDRALTAAKDSDAARTDQVQQMLAALGLTSELRNADYAGVAPTLSVINAAADLPYVGVGALNGNIRTASNGYGVQTTKQGGGLLGTILDSAGNAFGGSLGGKLAGKI